MVKYIFTLMLIFIFAGCSEKPTYKIKDARMSAMRDSIHWLDNEQVIFVNVNYQHVKSIYVWNTQTDELKLHRSNIDSNICYNDGYITYRSIGEDGRIYYRSGMFPNEEKYPAESIDKNTKFNHYSCKRFIPPEEHQDKFIRYLHEDHGYIDFGLVKPGIKYTPPTFFTNTKEEIVLPHETKVWKYDVGYYPFEGAYFFWRVISAYSSGWDYGYCKNVWWLYPDGKTKSVCLSFFNEINKGAVQVYPVYNGYLVVSHWVTSEGYSDKSGIYYFDEKMDFKSKLLTGKLDGVSVSNNGCKVVCRFTTSLHKKNTLQMLSLCKKHGH